MAFDRTPSSQYYLDSSDNDESIETDQVDDKTAVFYRNASIAIINGALYYFVSVTGGENLKNFLNLPDESADHIIHGLSVGASICYTMFIYKTLENLTLCPKSRAGWVMALLAPFAA